jgi:flagellar biogenesis protein FliO
VIAPLLLALNLWSAPSNPDSTGSSRPVTSPAAQDSSSRATVPDSVTAAHLRAVQEAWDKGPNSTTQDDRASLSAGSLAGGLFQVLSGFAFLALIAVAGLFVLRRVRGRSGSARGGSMIDVIETSPAGPGRQICLVRIHDRVVAVAFAQSSVAVVAEFTGASAAEILADSGTGRANVREFSATLDSFMDKFRRQQPSGDKR